MPSQYKQKRDQLIANVDSIEVLIMGTSNAADGADPNQFSLYAHNLAFGFQSIYFDRKLIEKYLPVLPRLKYVLLDLPYNGLYYDHNELRDFFYYYYYGINYKNRKFCKESFSHTFFVYTPEQTFSMILNNKKEVLVKGWINNEEENDREVMSLWKNKYRADLYSAVIKNWKGGDSVVYDLEAIIELLQSQNITPILISYPNYSLVRSLLDKSIIERGQNVANTLCQKYNILFLDYFDDDSFTSSDYYNCNHLNAKGAAKLSKKINEVIMNMEEKRIKDEHNIVPLF